MSKGTKQKEEILKKNYEVIIKAVTDTSKLDREKAEILKEREFIFKKMQDYVGVSARTTINQEEYDRKYNIMEEQFEKIKIKLDEINNKYVQRKAREASIEEFLRTINKNDQLLLEFDEELWNYTIESVDVYSERMRSNLRLKTI